MNTCREPGAVAQACNSSYFGGMGERTSVQSQLRQKHETLLGNKLKAKGLGT
jgi:hypothetical protein